MTKKLFLLCIGLLSLTAGVQAQNSSQFSAIQWPNYTLPGQPGQILMYSVPRAGIPVLGPSNLKDTGQQLLYKGVPINTAGSGSLNPTGSIVTGHCATWAGPTTLRDSGGTCGSGGVSITFTTTGTSGAATYNSGTGAMNIPQYQGAITLTTTGSSGAATLIGTALNIPTPSTGGSPNFSTIAGGTNTTAAMIVGTGGSLATSGSGSITATSMPYTGLSGSVPTWNQNTTGTAAGLSITGTTNQVFAAPNGSTGVGSFRSLVAADIPVTNQNTTGTAAGLAGSQTANFVYAAPSGSAGTAGFRALTVLDIPTGLNQNTTGTAGGLSGTPSISITNLLASGTITFSSIAPGSGSACLHISNTGAVTNTGADCGAGSSSNWSALIGGTNTTAAMVVGTGASISSTGSGAITATAMPYTGLTGSVPTWNQNTTGTAGGITGSQTANFFYAAPSGSAGTASFRAIVVADVPTLNQSTTGNAATASAVAVGGITGLATGVGTFLATPTSANLLAAVTNETGTGLLVFGTAPTITLPNATGLPLATGVTGILPLANGGTNAGTVTLALSNIIGNPAPGTYSIICSSVSSCTTVTATGGSNAFSAITSGTNTTAAMLVGAGASLGFTSTGTINASTLLSNTWAAPGAIGGTTPAAGAFTTISATGAISVGATPPTACGTATGCYAFTEASTAGTPTASQGYIRADSTTHTFLFSINSSTEAQVGTTITIAKGNSALNTALIATTACNTTTVAAAGVATTDRIVFTPNASIKAVTGYVPGTTGGLTITPFPTAGNVNFDVCNWTSGSITPGAVTLNWEVTR